MKNILGILICLVVCMATNIVYADGACCIGDTCYDGMDEGTCFMNMGIYQGDGSLCSDPSVICTATPTGACCLTNGTCSEMDEQTCIVQGTYQGDDTLCIEVSCPEPSGACCVGDTCVEDTPQSTCEGIMGGTFQGAGIPCALVQCEEPPTGACCLVNGTCSEMNEQTCSIQGTYQGDDTLCIEVSCPEPSGACCMPDDSCQEDTPQSTCESQGGTFQGAGIPCALVQCAEPPIGACCTSDSCSDDISQPVCEVPMGGTFMGEATECATVDCCWEVDNDGDGYGDPASVSCANPELDCDDDDSDDPAECPSKGGSCVCGEVACAGCAECINPGTIDLANDGIDSDCDPATPLWGPTSIMRIYQPLSSQVNTMILLIAPIGMVLLWRGLRRKR